MSVPLRIARLVLRGDLPVDALRPFTEPAPHATPRAVPQLTLWIRDVDGAPERPWRVAPDFRFDCVALACKGMRASVCVARQVASDSQRTRDTWRGQGSEYPTCVTEHCAQGRGIRAAFDQRTRAPWISRRTWFRNESRNEPATVRAKRIAEEAARRVLARQGLLDPVRTIDDAEDDPA